jgi:uncharacterized membrane protein
MKRFWRSKTFWVNALAAVALIAEGVSGREFVIPIETQAVILAAINLVLRKVTREPIGW